MHDGAQGVHDGLRGEVFRRDQGDGADLTVSLLLDNLGNLGVRRVQSLLGHVGVRRGLGGVGCSEQASVERPGESSESLHLWWSGGGCGEIRKSGDTNSADGGFFRQLGFSESLFGGGLWWC